MEAKKEVGREVGEGGRARELLSPEHARTQSHVPGSLPG